MRTISLSKFDAQAKIQELNDKLTAAEARIADLQGLLFKPKVDSSTQTDVAPESSSSESEADEPDPPIAKPTRRVARALLMS